MDSTTMILIAILVRVLRINRMVVTAVVKTLALMMLRTMVSDCGDNGFSSSLTPRREETRYLLQKQYYSGFDVTHLQCDNDAGAGYTIGYSYSSLEKQDMNDLGTRKRSCQNDPSVP